MAGDITFDDLAKEAGEAAEQTQTPDKSTGEWMSETLELLDKRGLLEPVLFGPEKAAEVKQQTQKEAEEMAADRDDGDGLDLDAESIAEAGEAIMDQLGDDVTVAELVQICESNPSMVNKQIQEAL